MITYKELGNVTFPAFPLDIDNTQLLDGLLFLDGRLVDDRNMPGNTLGLRRLQSPMPNIYPLNRGVLDIATIIRRPSGSYIDSLGKMFTYTKTIFAQLKYHKIRKIEKKDTYSVLWISNFNFPFKIPRPPNPKFTWAGILHIKGYPWQLYSYSETKIKDSVRKI